MRSRYAKSAGLGILVAVVLLGGPIWADVVILKDGRRIETREPYRVEGDQAILVLANGTVTTLPVASVDTERTRQENEAGYGSARVIEGRESRPVQRSAPQQNRNQSELSAVASQRRLRATPSTNRPTPVAPREIVRQPLSDEQASQLLRRLYNSQGFTAELFEGSATGTAIARLTTDNESDVFRGLVTTALALLESSEKLESPLAVVELEMRTSDGGQAGDFRITHDRAEALRSRTISPQAFYVRYVEF